MSKPSDRLPVCRSVAWAQQIRVVRPRNNAAASATTTRREVIERYDEDDDDMEQRGVWFVVFVEGDETRAVNTRRSPTQ